MYKIKDFLEEFPQFTLNTQYAPSNDELSTTVGFFNYFSNTFRGEEIGADVYFFFFNADGEASGSYKEHVGSSSSLQFETLANSLVSDGLVAVGAVPDKDLFEMARERKLKLKSPITTGFYVKWESNDARANLMHEWAPVTKTTIPKAKHHVGLNEWSTIKDGRHGMVLMNPIIETGQSGKTRIRVRNVSKNLKGSWFELDPIPPLGTRLVYFDEAVRDWSDISSDGSKMLIDIVCENTAPPLTVEKLGNDDIHIHHL